MSMSARQVRHSSTPTALSFGSQLPCGSVAHKALVVGDPTSPHGVLTSELRRIGAGGVDQETHSHVTLPPAMIKQLSRAPVIGHTQMTDGEIVHHARELIKTHGPYHPVWRNCQHFAYALAKSITGETIIKPDRNARYRFTREILSLVNHPFTGTSDGWISPTATKVLVNVKETDDADTWMGQVEGSDEHGKFRCNTVERLL